MEILPSRKCLILGGANTLEQDRTEALELFEPDLVIACNHAARDAPYPVDHWVTMHPELFPMWIRARRSKGLPDIPSMFHPRHKPSKVDSVQIDSWGGSSGFLCVRVAFHLRCSHIVLAGVPMKKSLRHYDDDQLWKEARQYWPAWERKLDIMKDRVRSMSGWTMELLGRPTPDWLDANAT